MSRLLRWIALALGALMALAVGAYAVVNVVEVLNARSTRADLDRQLTARLADAVPAARASQAAARALSGLGEPELAWLVQSCAFPTDDAGWIVQQYRQTCWLDGILAYPAETRDAAADLVAGADPGVVGVPIPPEETPVDGHCQILTETRDGPRFTSTRFVPAAGPDEAFWCGDAIPPRRHRVIDGAPGELARDHGWLLVTRSEDLLDAPIGCQHWSALFCSNPFGDDPAWGTLP